MMNASTLREARYARTASGALTVLLLAAAPAWAQENPLGQPLLDADGNIRDDAYIHIPLRSDDTGYGDIQADQLKDWLMEVDAISLADRDAGNLFWGHNVGTEGHEAIRRGSRGTSAAISA
jgi:hypothetical protein